MLSPEFHTLDQEKAAELPEMLLARAVEIGAAGSAAYAPKAPDNPGAFLYTGANILDESDIERSPALSVIGDYMTPLESAQKDFEEMHDSELVGDLMRHASISKLTGCIMVGLSRDYKGYTKTGIKAVRELGLGSTSRQTHRVVHFARMAEQTGQLPTQEELSKEVDHLCRNPSCVYHTRLIEGNLNNDLMAEARKVEPEIVAGQMLYAADLLDELPWLSFTLAEEGAEPAKFISTRLGPYVLRLANSNEIVVYGERVSCEAYDNLKSLGKKPKRRKSRAKARIPKPIRHQAVLFTKLKYRKKSRLDQESIYNQTLQAA